MLEKGTFIFGENNIEYQYVLECVNNWIDNDYNDSILLEDMMTINEISNEYIARMINPNRNSVFSKFDSEETRAGKENLVSTLQNYNTKLNRHIKDGSPISSGEKHVVKPRTAFNFYVLQTNKPLARQRNKTTNARDPITGLRPSQINARYMQEMKETRKKIRNYIQSIDGPKQRYIEALYTYFDNSNPDDEYNSKMRYINDLVKKSPEELRQMANKIGYNFDEPSQTKTSTKPTPSSNSTNNNIKTQKKSGFGWKHAAAGTVAVGALGAGLLAYKHYKNKPKSVIGQRIQALRNIYRKWMLQAQRNPRQAGVLKSMAAKLMGVIDKLMGYLQNTAG